MAFLHLVVNAGGTIDREYAIGWGRMDLCVRYACVILGIELKVWRDGEPDPIYAGLKQIDGHLDGIGQDAGWLVIFESSIAEAANLALANGRGWRQALLCLVNGLP